MPQFVWNPWHGCHKYSAGCQNCYVYRRDSSIGKDASEITKNRDFDLPIRQARNGSYKIPDGSTIFTCMTSDFFIEEADEWRGQLWDMIRQRQDAAFIIITKRIVRFKECMPANWGNGWQNVEICCTMENQQECDRRFPIFNAIPAVRKTVICEPLLSHINMEDYLSSRISRVIAGGESGNNARICDFDWILSLRRQCLKVGVPFHFKQTGARLRKDGRIYRILRKDQHSQAQKANIDIF